MSRIINDAFRVVSDTTSCSVIVRLSIVILEASIDNCIMIRVKATEHCLELLMGAVFVSMKVIAYSLFRAENSAPVAYAIRLCLVIKSLSTEP
jgi:hypothetical protein